MFEDKKKILAIIFLALGIVMSLFGFLAGIISLFMGKLFPAAVLIILVLGIGAFLVMAAITSDYLD